MKPRPTPRLRHRITLTLLAASLGALGACSGSLLPKPAPAPARYALDTLDALDSPDAGSAMGAKPALGLAPASLASMSLPAALTASTASAALSTDARSLAVEPLRAAPAYDSRRMVYQRAGGQLESFAFHEWVAPPAEMLAPLLVRALQQAGGSYTVLPAPTAVAADWRLETQLLRLVQDFSVQPSRLRLSLRAVLLDSASRRVLGWREVNISLPTTSEDPQAGAAAAQAAAQQATQAVAAFCAEQLRGAATARPKTAH